jgi:hypothetical protein
LHELEHAGGRLGRYLRLGAQTVALLWRTPASVVFVQNPSLILALLAVLLRRFRHWVLVVDAHNAGVYPLEGSGWLSRMLGRLLFRGADLTLVSNPPLADYVGGRGGRAYVMPDPLPDIDSAAVPEAGTGGCRVVFICTWAADEPYLEVIEAARALDPGIEILITGRSRGREEPQRPLPANVTLTGFVPEEAFLDLLRDSDVVMDLTTREDCLVCGAYEGVAVGRPLVLSDTQALRAYFSRGSVFAQNTAQGIAAAVTQACKERPRLREEVMRLAAELESEWMQRLAGLREVLAELRHGR